MTTPGGRGSRGWFFLLLAQPGEQSTGQNPRVEILNYVTEETWDTVMWQTVERKARFIGQIKTGDLDARTAEDLGSDELGNSAAATKAVATGDPRYLQQVQLDDDVKRLDALKRAHGDAKGRNAAERRACAREITATTEQLSRLDEALPRIAASADAPFAMTIGGRTYRERGPVLLASKTPRHSLLRRVMRAGRGLRPARRRGAGPRPRCSGRWCRFPPRAH